MSYLEKFQQPDGQAQTAVHESSVEAKYYGPHTKSQKVQRDKPAQPPELVEIGLSRMEEVVALEQRSYPSPWSPDLVRGEFYKEVSYRLGLVSKGSVVAYSFCYLIPQDLHILNIAVAPESRGKGFGKYLLCNLLSRAIEHKVHLVGLEVRPSNATARALYGQLGFKAVGMRREYYRDNGEDALLLERHLGPDDASFFEKFSRDSLNK